MDETARFALPRELESVRALDHPHIVSFRGRVHLDEQFWFACEYCPGGSLERLAARHGGRMPPWPALPVAHQVLTALAYAHGVPLPGRRPGARTRTPGRERPRTSCSRTRDRDRRGRRPALRTGVRRRPAVAGDPGPASRADHESVCRGRAPVSAPSGHPSSVDPSGASTGTRTPAICCSIVLGQSNTHGPVTPPTRVPRTPLPSWAMRWRTRAR